MPKLEKKIVIEAPPQEVFEYLDRPAHLPEIWPSLYEVKNVKTLPNGGHSFIWFNNFAGKQICNEYKAEMLLANLKAKLEV